MVRAVKTSHYHFEQLVHRDSTGVDYIPSKAPYLRRGINALHIDADHERGHVERELTRWYPHLAARSWILLHDADANLYRMGIR